MNNTKINAVVVADSINPYGNRITSLLVTMPRIILAEFNTHRMFSRNTSSSRAIPFNKMVEAVQNNPFIPIAWQKDHKGMQGNEYYTNEVDIQANIIRWNAAKERAIKYTIGLNEQGVTKQLCNRLLEPFQWCTSLVTATEYDNFFNLRCPVYEVSIEGFGIQHFKSKLDLINAVHESELEKYGELDTLGWLQLNKGKAEIHLMELAECMWDAINESTPKELKPGQWHIPFGDNISMSILDQHEIANKFPDIKSKEDLKIRIATARCARVSYTVVGEEGKEPNYENDIKLHDRLAASSHWSPFEHCAKVPTEDEYRNSYRGNIKPIHIESDFTYTEEIAEINLDNCGWFDNFHGFQSYRNILENETSI